MDAECGQHIVHLLFFNILSLRESLLSNSSDSSLEELQLKLGLFLDDSLEVRAYERVHLLVLSVEVPKSVVLNVVCDHAILVSLQVILDWGLVQTDSSGQIEEVHLSLVHHHHNLAVGDEGGTLQNVARLHESVVLVLHEGDL